MRYLLILCLFCGSAFGQAWSMAVKENTASVIAAAAGGCTTVYAQNTTALQAYGMNVDTCQLVSNSTALVSCKLSALLRTTDGAGKDVYLIGSSTPSGGTVYFQTVTNTYSLNTTNWVDFSYTNSTVTWPTTNVFIHVQVAAGTSANLWWMANTSGGYLDSTYCAYTGGSANTGTDTGFKVWTP